MFQPEVSRVPVFRPTMEELRDLPKFIAGVESRKEHLLGVIKIIPPAEYKPRRGGYDDIGKIIIPEPIQQRLKKIQRGVFEHETSTNPAITIEDFYTRSIGRAYKSPSYNSFASMDQGYWKSWESGTLPSPYYGADINMSLMDSDLEHLNLTKLGSILDQLDTVIPGVTTPYLYIGSYRSTFPFHVEDKSLYSINYVHLGGPKIWNVIPPASGKAFEAVLEKLFPHLSSQCKAFISHKRCVVAPEILDMYKIPYTTVVQEEGEFVITFPYAYHQGYNSSYNIAEATNFASDSWISYGQSSIQCECENAAPVQFSMETFINNNQRRSLSNASSNTTAIFKDATAKAIDIITNECETNASNKYKLQIDNLESLLQAEKTRNSDLQTKNSKLDVELASARRQLNSAKELIGNMEAESRSRFTAIRKELELESVEEEQIETEHMNRSSNNGNQPTPGRKRKSTMNITFEKKSK